MDPVGQEDGDIDNDGDKDSSDEYLMKKEKASVKHEERWWWKRAVDTKTKWTKVKNYLNLQHKKI